MANYFRALGALPAQEIVVRYPPEALKYRPRTRAHLQGLGCACRSSGLSDAAQVSSAARTAALVAKVGSIVPGIGNVVGAVGAIYGALAGKKKPVRPSAEQISQCNQVVSEYEQLIAQYPATPLGAALGEGNLKSIFVCYEMVRAGTTKDPRFLDGNWQLKRDVAVEAVQKAFNAPAGTQVRLTTEGRRDIKGKAFRPFTLTYTNTEANSLQSIADKVAQFEIGSCANYNDRGKCESINATAYMRHAYLDLVAWAASTYLPQVEIPREPTAPIAQQPSSPGPAAPAPSVPVPSSAMPPNVAPPAITAPPALPPNATADQINAAIAQLTSMFLQTQQAQAMSQQQAASAAAAAAQQWLASQGVRAPAIAVQETARAAVTQAGMSANLPLWLGGAALVFALARPAPTYRGSRRR